MDEKKKLPLFGVGAFSGLLLCVFAEKIMESAEKDFKLNKAKAQDTSCLVSWYYKRKAVKSFNVWQEGWIKTTTFKNNLRKLNEEVSKKTEEGRCESGGQKEETAKVRESNSRSKRIKVRK